MKSRLQGKRDLRRPKPSRREQQRLLIVCEGKSTEPGYLRGLLRMLRATAVDVHSVDVKHAGVTHPLGVVQETIKIQAKASHPYDQCWCLTDVDSHAGLAAACAMATRAGINIVISNPCFEIWLLWHYKEHRSEISGTDLRRQLREFGHRDKNIPTTFPFDAEEAALKRSHTADPRQVHNVLGPNPSTAFGVLLKALRR